MVIILRLIHNLSLFESSPSLEEGTPETLHEVEEEVVAVEDANQSDSNVSVRYVKHSLRVNSKLVTNLCDKVSMIN